MTEPESELVLSQEVLRRPVDPARYRGLARPDKTRRLAMDELARVESMRSDHRTDPTRLADSLAFLADLLTELGWDDLASLARREELGLYRAGLLTVSGRQRQVDRPDEAAAAEAEAAGLADQTDDPGGDGWLRSA